MVVVTADTVRAGPNSDKDWAGRVKKVKLDIQEAIDRGMKKVGSGKLFCAELKPDRMGLVYSLDIVQCTKMRSLLIDAANSDVVQNLLEHEDHTDAVNANIIGMKRSIQKALAKYPGAAFYAIHFKSKGRPGTLVSLVREGEVMSVVVDGASGDVASRETSFGELQKDDFTRPFGEKKSNRG